MALQRWASRAGILGRLVGFLWRERLWWMIPMLLVLLACGALIFVAQGTAMSPFIYTLF